MNFEHINFIENPLLDGGLRKKQIIKKSQKDKPLVTIITAVFNGEKYLEECIKSLHNMEITDIYFTYYGNSFPNCCQRFV